MGGCYHLDSPWLYRNPWTDDPDELGRLCAEQLEREIEFQMPDTVAAFIAEPVQGAGGVIVPPANYWPLIREVCDRYGVLLIADEVVTGFGRSGSMFGSRGWGVKPDIMALAKGLSSGYIPLGATVVNQRIEAAFDKNADFGGAIMHGYTYSGHPIGCAAAIAALNIVRDENLPENAKVQGQYLLERLQPMIEKHPSVGDVRGKGLMIALDLVVDKETREPIDPAGEFANDVAAVARREGVLVRPVGTKIILSPPLIFLAGPLRQSGRRVKYRVLPKWIAGSIDVGRRCRGPQQCAGRQQPAQPLSRCSTWPWSVRACSSCSRASFKGWSSTLA